MSVTYAVVVPNRIGAGWVGARRPVAHGGSDRVHQPSQQVYARRRLMVGLMIVSLVAVAWVGTSSVLANRGSVPASTPAVRPAAAATPLVAAAELAAVGAPTYIVQPGDTLWTIGARLHGDRSLADYVASLVEANGGASLEIGQQLVLPA
jgi:hypothetical protein